MDHDVMDVWPQRVFWRQQVTAYRKANHLKLADVARDLDIAESTLKDYLYTRDVRPSVELLQRSVEVLGGSLTDYLTDPAAPVPGHTPREAQALSDDEKAQLRAMGTDLQSLTADQRSAAIRVWRATVDAFLHAGTASSASIEAKVIRAKK